MLICWVFAFLGSLLLLDIPEFTDRFAILEGIYFFFLIDYRTLCFCGFARAGFRLWDWFGGLKFCRTYGAYFVWNLYHQGLTSSKLLMLGSQSKLYYTCLLAILTPLPVI